jgi:hypothetical protein
MALGTTLTLVQQPKAGGVGMHALVRFSRRFGRRLTTMASRTFVAIGFAKLLDGPGQQDGLHFLIDNLNTGVAG